MERRGPGFRCHPATRIVRLRARITDALFAEMHVTSKDHVAIVRHALRSSPPPSSYDGSDAAVAEECSPPSCSPPLRAAGP